MIADSAVAWTGRLAAVGILVAMASAQARTSAPAPHAPPVSCAATFGQWCALQDVSATVVRRDEKTTLVQLRPSEPYPHDGDLFVISPAACSQGHADQMTFAGLTLDTPFGDGFRDALAVRLSATCQVTVMLPKWTGDSLDWPYRTGLTLVRNCTDDACAGFSFGLLRPRFEIKYRRQLIRP